MEADADAVGADEGGEAGLVPDDERQVAADVKRRLVRVVVAEVFAEIAGAGRHGITVPDKAEIALRGGDELVRIDEAMIREPLRALYLIHLETIPIEMEREAVQAMLQLVEEPVFAHPEAAGVEDGIGRRGHGFTWNRAGVGEVIPDAEARRGELATLGAEPIGHGVVERNEGVGVGEAGDFLRRGQLLAAERAEVVNERNHSRPSPMRHITDECKIFLQRILQEQAVAPADAEAHGADAGQRAEEAVHLVVRARLGKAEVDESLFGPNPLHVCFRLAPGAAHIFVVAR